MIVTAPRLVRAVGKLATGRDDTRALALFPVIFIRDETQNMPWVISHERIHFRQQLETLFIGVWIVSIVEHIYARLVLRKSKEEAYLYKAVEQEAYRNQQDMNYLQHRKFWSYFHYVFHKRNFTFGAPGEIIYLD